MSNIVTSAGAFAITPEVGSEKISKLDFIEQGKRYFSGGAEPHTVWYCIKKELLMVKQTDNLRI